MAPANLVVLGEVDRGGLISLSGLLKFLGFQDLGDMETVL